MNIAGELSSLKEEAYLWLILLHIRLSRRVHHRDLLLAVGRELRVNRAVCKYTVVVV